MYCTLMAKKSADQHILTRRIGQIGTFLRKTFGRWDPALEKRERRGGRIFHQAGRLLGRWVCEKEEERELLREPGGRGTFPE